MWSFKPFETADKDAGIQLTTGTFIDESMYAFAGGKDNWGQGTINHMTLEQNQQWAQKKVKNARRSQRKQKQAQRNAQYDSY